MVPMVQAYHLIFSAYGFWLPNDPRGSWSDFVRAWELWWFGDATKTTERRSVAHRPHDRKRRLAAKTALKYEPVEFTGKQALAIANGFRKALEEAGYVILACSILPTHVHIVLLRCDRPAERVVGHLKARATQQLVAEGLHPFVEHELKDGRFPSVWAHRAWKVFLDSVEDIERAIKYVEANPLKEGKPKQRWSFVTPYRYA
jgi:REP element-mobilizing transposase RayT